MRIPFVPKEYSYIECHGFRLWHSEDECKYQIELIIEAGEYAFDYVCSKLNFKNLRNIEICLYHSNHQAVSSLKRKITGNMAMAPYSTDQGGLVIVQSAASDPMNGDLQRLRRILTHEICHLFVREKSGSSSVLGDGLKDMKVRPWVDEGFAEYLSWRCIGKENSIFQEDAEYIDDLDEVDQLLNDFNSDRRGVAFYTSSRLVEYFIGKGYSIKIYDPNVSLARLVGTNKAYIEQEIPHISQLLTENMDEVVSSDIIVINHDYEIKDNLSDKTVIDLR